MILKNEAKLYNKNHLDINISIIPQLKLKTKKIVHSSKKDHFSYIQKCLGICRRYLYPALYIHIGLIYNIIFSVFSKSKRQNPKGGSRRRPGTSRNVRLP